MSALPRFEELLLRGKKTYHGRKAMREGLMDLAEDVQAGELHLVDLSLLAAATDPWVIADLADSEDCLAVCDALQQLFVLGSEVGSRHLYRILQFIPFTTLCLCSLSLL